ncbi:MAG: glycosyltransferase family 61 protein [Deltaproteobacteria bacterium]|nr:glycosyltransferase family 61 protein [Deltaproteobacteria bacterium]MBK8717792.1 glycosyltransferase family 61 protein [Deltaproteobacteria bacterium]MBP7287846.1 glycosyltransferase family 61 protein [Nannocystaceae bacterium]
MITRWTPWPLVNMLQSRLRVPMPPLEAGATRQWQLAPGRRQVVPKAFFLDGQLERVRRWVFADEHPGREMHGGHEVRHGPTRAMLLEQVWLVDGVLYHGRACEHLQPRAHRLPRLRVDRELGHGALACSQHGNQYFGSWLMDDVPRYFLAEGHGEAIVTAAARSEHQRDYAARLELRATPIAAARIRQLVVFDDRGQNHDKAARAALVRERLAGADAARHPGVFLLRGEAGMRRVLRGERALAEQLARTRGLTILDPMRTDVATIIARCAGAALVVGVEGSGLIHGAQLLRPGASLLVLQPPDRFCAVFKHLADRDGLHFAFVVGRAEGEDFAVDADEVERTLDLLPA